MEESDLDVVQLLLEDSEINALVDYCQNIILSSESIEDTSTGSESNKETLTSSNKVEDPLESSKDNEVILPSSDGNEETLTDSEVNKETLQLACSMSNEEILQNSESKELLPISNYQDGILASSTLKQLEFNEMECPCTWTCSSKFKEMDWVGYLLCKLSKPSSNDWRVYNLQLLLACIYGLENNEAKAFEILHSCEKIIDEHSDDSFFKDMMEGLHHMINASKCHINLHNGKSDDIASVMTPLQELSNVSKGAIWATKAYIHCMFGNDGKEKALEYIKKAIELDPDKDGTRRGAWYYLAGKIYTQIREIDPRNKLPGKEEIEMYHKAVGKNPFPEFVVSLACKYGEAGKGFMNRYLYNRSKSHNYYKLSLGMIEKALAESKLSGDDMIRLVSELNKLPKQHHPPKVVNQYLETALKNLEEKFDELLDSILKKEDSHKLEMILDSAASLIKVNDMIYRNYNPTEVCDKIISILENSLPSKNCAELKIFFFLVIGEYYLTRKKNMLKTVKMWEKAIEIDSNSAILLNYKTQLGGKPMTLNIYEVLKKEIKKQMKSTNFSNQNKRYLNRILKICENQEKTT